MTTRPDGSTRLSPASASQSAASRQILERCLRRVLLVHTVTSEAIEPGQRSGVAVGRAKRELEAPGRAGPPEVAQRRGCDRDRHRRLPLREETAMTETNYAVAAGEYLEEWIDDRGFSQQHVADLQEVSTARYDPLD